jgi:hypothetical protein
MHDSMLDPPEWYTNPEHEHLIGIDHSLGVQLSQEFGIPGIEVDCGVEGSHSYSYHFRIMNVPRNQWGFVITRAIDLLSAWTPYRFEVRCIYDYLESQTFACDDAEVLEPA